MKNLICAAVVAASMFAMAEEAKTEAAPSAAKTVETVKQAPRRAKMTDEQRAQMKAKRDQFFMAQRKAAMEAKLMEVVKKYVPEEEKAKAFIAELQEAMMPARRGGMRPMKAKTAAPAK